MEGMPAVMQFRNDPQFLSTMNDEWGLQLSACEKQLLDSKGQVAFLKRLEGGAMVWRRCLGPGRDWKGQEIDSREAARAAKKEDNNG